MDYNLFLVWMYKDVSLCRLRICIKAAFIGTQGLNMWVSSWYGFNVYQKKLENFGKCLQDFPSHCWLIHILGLQPRPTCLGGAGLLEPSNLSNSGSPRSILLVCTWWIFVEVLFRLDMKMQAYHHRPQQILFRFELELSSWKLRFYPFWPSVVG